MVRASRTPDEYEQVYSGQYWDLSGDDHIECCRCGLRHRVFVRIHKGKIQMRMDLERSKKRKR